MSSQDKVSVDQYGRKKWNVEAYAQEAKDRKRKRRADDDDRVSKHTLKNDTSQAYIDHRAELLKASLDAVQQYSLINPDKAGSAMHGAKKRFGFFCPVCDLSFRDDLALIDHFNSPQHVNKVMSQNQKKPAEGEEEDAKAAQMLESGIRRASLAEVVATMEKLISRSVAAKVEAKEAEGVSFGERVKRRKEFEEKRMSSNAEKRHLRNQRKKQKRDAHKQVAARDGDGDGGGAMSQMMGFANFGSTKLNS
ncbi:uncharacterized protein LODBEIA_P03710 [Lodderomyces beijingensis]|uniref:C2H2-type domain-containing protein n=1 Tax=Lodderomyces beijingensis TaxID=1775926 RepID=A0ABP0ZD95_9ASCO